MSIIAINIHSHFFQFWWMNKENEALKELNKAIAFKPELQMLHLWAAFYESMGELHSALKDCESALCLDPNHMDTLDLYNKMNL